MRARRRLAGRGRVDGRQAGTPPRPASAAPAPDSPPAPPRASATPFPHERRQHLRSGVAVHGTPQRRADRRGGTTYPAAGTSRHRRRDSSIQTLGITESRMKYSATNSASSSTLRSLPSIVLMSSLRRRVTSVTAMGGGPCIRSRYRSHTPIFVAFGRVLLETSSMCASSTFKPLPRNRRPPLLDRRAFDRRPADLRPDRRRGDLEVRFGGIVFPLHR